MGLYDIIKLDDDVNLPEFEGNPHNMEWQSKDVESRPFMRIFKITNDGRLLERNESKRPMTDEEITERANEAGYDSWDEWEKADDTFGPLESWKQVTDEVWWDDIHKHGSFEMHGIKDSTYWSYEVRYTKGELDEIILLSKS